MHRLGFCRDEISDLCNKLVPGETKVKSLFSHLAGSDEERLDDFTHEQVQLFENMSETITNHLSYPVMRHILNSAGVERFPEFQFEMVRIGIGL